MPFSTSESVEDLAVFDPTIWINQNKRYEQNPPLPIAEARNRAYAISDVLSTLLPPISLSVTKFIKIWLPDQSDYGLPFKTDLWFSRDPPVTDPTVLFMRPIPPERTLHLLHVASGQKWLDGCQSIRDPRYPGGTEQFPLGALEFWLLLAQMKPQQCGWCKTVSWISELASQPAKSDAYDVQDLALYACELLSRLPWNAKAKLYNITTTTADLSRFTNMHSLSDTNLDLILAFFNQTYTVHLRQSCMAAIGLVALMEQLLRVSKKQDFARICSLHSIEMHVTSGPEAQRLRNLYMPAFVNGGHWIMVHVNFVNGIIEYGDLLDLRQKVTKELNAVNAWLRWFTTFVSQCLDMDAGTPFEAPLELTTNTAFSQNSPMPSESPDPSVSAGVSPTSGTDIAAATVHCCLFLIFENQHAGSVIPSTNLTKCRATFEAPAADSRASKCSKPTAPPPTQTSAPPATCSQGRSSTSERNRRNAWKNGTFKVIAADLIQCGATTHILEDLFQDRNPASNDVTGPRIKLRPATPPKDLEPRRCPALTANNDARIATYLLCTGASGGSSQSVANLAQECYGHTYKDLTTREKAIIDDDYETLLKRSNLLKNTDSIRALNHNAADEDKMKYTNKRYQDAALGDLFIKTSGLCALIQARDAGSLYIRYALGVIDGTYKDNKVLSGLMRSQLMLVDKEVRGVGKQNFQWPEAYDRFLHILMLESPAAYRELAKYLPTRSERSFCMIQSKSTIFSMMLSDEMYDLASECVKDLGYNGPVALACDDTKLILGWRLWWCSKEESYYLISAVTGPLRVSNPETLQMTINDAHAIQATKVRVYTIQIPLPSVAPIIIAALPISDSMSGAALCELTQPIVYRLLKRGIHIVSMASDGAQVERVHQRLFKLQALTRRTFSIPGSRSLDTLTLVVDVTVVDDHPIVQIQDALHGCKTARNNLFSGARLLTFSNYTMTSAKYVKCWRMPTAHFTDAIGEIVFLYVLGELIDAYQNRLISHSERLRMVLRAWYFVRMWQMYLRMCGYLESRYCMSAEALDIVRILVEGYFALLIIHHDIYSRPKPFPLLPWLHSSEPVEHTFGCACQNRADFTLMDLYDMMKKVQFQIAEAVSLGKISDAKVTASGYNHTYFDVRDINLHALATYPSDTDITRISLEALEDAEALVTVLEILPEHLYSSDQSSMEQSPSLRDDAGLKWDDDAASDDGSDMELDEVDIATDLLQILRNEERHLNLRPRSLQQDEHILNLSLAAAALTLDDMLESYEVDPEREHGICNTEQCATSKSVRHASSQGVKTHESKPPVHKAVADTARMQLTRKFYAALREIQGPGGSITKTRVARWCESQSTGEKASGNTVNAAVTTTAAAKAVIKKCEQAFSMAGIPKPLLPLLTSAKVSAVQPLKIGDYGFIYTESGLGVGKVKAMYTKTRGKGGRHTDVADVSTFGAISYVCMQVFEHRYLRQFGSVSKATAQFWTKRYAHLPSYEFLTLFFTPPQAASEGVLIGAGDIEIFQQLKDARGGLQEAQRLFRQRGKRAKAELEEEVEEN
ncbi:hypothetical protein NM688_g1522 [Phlebia brevispora]|uniref:Uncharacterized protein n=1 Tax=Phlebia brevispora TaxID=194682 RepID=A0ACC1TBG3_9APHY|nr:hypothetical protein NM688_g1522 [Phlebia brevispora]